MTVTPEMVDDAQAKALIALGVVKELSYRIREDYSLDGVMALVDAIDIFDENLLKDTLIFALAELTKDGRPDA